MSKQTIYYVGRKPMVRDTVAGTGLSWAAGESHEVDAAAAGRLLKHPDVWSLASIDNWRAGSRSLQPALALAAATEAPAVPLGFVQISEEEYLDLLEAKSQLGQLMAQALAVPTNPPAADKPADKPTEDAKAPNKPAEDAGPHAALRAMSTEALDAHLAALNDDEVREIGNAFLPEPMDGRHRGQALRVKVFELVQKAGA